MELYFYALCNFRIFSDYDYVISDDKDFYKTKIYFMENTCSEYDLTTIFIVIK